jgi:hypothetical protein
MCEFDLPSLVEPPLDASQDSLDRAPGQFPGSGHGGAAFRVIAQVVGKLGARTSVAQAAGLIHNHRICGGTILEASEILEIRARDLVAQPALQSQRDALPGPEISRIALGGSVDPKRIGQRGRGLEGSAAVICHRSRLIVSPRRKGSDPDEGDKSRDRKQFRLERRL